MPSPLNSASPALIYPAALLAAIRAADEAEAATKLREALDRDEAGIRQRCRTLYGFIREAWSILEPSTPFVGGWALEAICDHLEAVTRGDITRLLITVPPGMSKSLTTAVFWPAWEWGAKGRESKRYLTTSYSGPNVLRDNNNMRKLVESEWYQRLWGSQVRPTAKWGEKIFINTRTGKREGRPFKSMTGGRGDAVIIDDPHSTESAESDKQRKATVRTFREQLTDRLNDPSRSAIVVIMQRLHEGDVAGTILDLGLPYVHLNLPMEFESTRKVGSEIVDARCRTYVNGDLFFEDPRTKEGELLFPERFPREAVEAIKKAKGSYAYAGQYQQRPAPREGGLFKREWFEDRILPLCPPIVTWVRAWDLAGSEKRATNDPDASAGVKMGRTHDGRFIIAHVDRFMLSPGPTESRIKGAGATDGQAVPIHLPIEPAQAGLYQLRGLVQALAGHTVRAERPGGSKEARAMPLATQAEHGNVYLVQGEWTANFLDELCLFPMGRYDDQVDAAADAFNFLAPITGDSRYATAGPRVSAGLITETRDAEMMRQMMVGNRHAAPGRQQGIL